MDQSKFLFQLSGRISASVVNQTDVLMPRICSRVSFSLLFKKSDSKRIVPHDSIGNVLSQRAQKGGGKKKWNVNHRWAIRQVTVASSFKISSASTDMAKALCQHVGFSLHTILGRPPCKSPASFWLDCALVVMREKLLLSFLQK